MPDAKTLAEEWEKEKQKENDENDSRLNAVKDFQSKQHNHTCMMPTDMAADMIVNDNVFPVNGKKKPYNQSKDSLKIAPGEGKIPTTQMREKHMDAKAFPRHHPTGKYGLNYEREFKLSPSQYFNQRLMHEDERFSKDAFYVFMAASYVERHGIERQIDISGVKGKTDNLGNGEKKVWLNDLFDVFKKIKGTPKYWQTARNELVAKVKQLGPFHMFYTFSCGEMRWSEVFISLLNRKGYKVEIPQDWDGDDDNLLVQGKKLWDFVNKDMAEKQHDLFNEYTFLIARHFDNRVKMFVQNILLGHGKGKVEISYYSYRVEFQARGLPHIHGVAWIAKHVLEEMEITGELMDNEEAALKLVDKLLSCKLPDDNENLKKIVTEVQKHKHTDSCKKYTGKCRYGFPRLPSAKTLLARPIEETHPNLDEKGKAKMKERATKIFEEAKNVLNEKPFNEEMTLSEFCHKIGTNEKEYEELLGISQRGKVLILKRECKERFINNYNPEMLTAWNANMDLQIVVDPYAVISYIASYMNKEETQTTPFLREAVFATAGQETKERLKALKEAYISHRQIGASEAAYKVTPHLRLKDSNISCIFVVTGFLKNRSVFFRKVQDDTDEDVEFEDEISESVSDEESEPQLPSKSKRFKIQNRPGTYTEAVNVLDRYKMRPKYLEDMCLAQFATSYVYASTIPKRIIFDEDGCSNEYSDQMIFDPEKNLPKYIALGEDLGKMRLRAFPCVLRIHNSKKKVEHEMHYSEMLLFSKWRNEVTEFHPEEMKKCIDIYKERIDEIHKNKDRIYPGEGTKVLIENLDLELLPPAHIFDTLDGQRQQDADEDLAIGEVPDPAFESFAYTGNLGQQNDGDKYENHRYRKIEMPNDDEIKFLTRRLVPEQLDILREVDRFCKDIDKSENNITHKVKPLRIMVHGGAGKKSILKLNHLLWSLY